MISIEVTATNRLKRRVLGVMGAVRTLWRMYTAQKAAPKPSVQSTSCRPERHDSHIPSIDIVRRELDRQAAQQATRSSSFDARAGLIVGFSGVSIGIATKPPNLLEGIGLCVAAVAAVAGVWSIFPRLGQGLIPRQYRNLLIAIPQHEAELQMLDTRIRVYELDEIALNTKVMRMRVAFVALAAATALLVAGSIERGLETGAPHPTPAVPTSAQPTPTQSPSATSR